MVCKKNRRIIYEKAEDIKKIALEIIKILDWHHIDLSSVGFIRSFNSKARGTIARCHALGKAMQTGMQRNKSFYVIEIISERFDRLSEEERLETIIHELMHIPKSFGGGFRHHDVVNDENVKNVYEKFISLKEEKEKDSENL